MQAAKMKPDHMRHVALSYGWDPAQAEPEFVAKHLQRLVAVRYPEEDVVECSVCGFECPDTIELPTCPGCGVAFGSPTQQPSEGDSMPQAQAEAKVVDISVQKPGKPVRRPKTAPEPTEEKPTKEAKQKEDKEAKEAEKRSAESKALKRLETISKKVDKELSTQAGSAWRIGKALSEVYLKDLWKADLGEDFKSFVDYAKRRFNFGKDTALGYIRIADTFTEQEATEMSVSRLWWLARVEDRSERETLAKQVKSGELRTVRELVDAVKVKRQEAGLQTERKGFEGTVALSGRIQSGGVVAEGEFEANEEALTFQFELAGLHFEIRANNEDYKVEVVHLDE